MKINEITEIIVDRSLHIHRRLGPGLLESVYQRVLIIELRKAGLVVQSEVPVSIVWDDEVIDESFRADLLVEDQVIVELKSVEETTPLHRKQVLTYIKLADKEVGLLINFGERLVKNGVHRLVNNYQD